MCAGSPKDVRPASDEKRDRKRRRSEKGAETPASPKSQTLDNPDREAFALQAGGQPTEEPADPVEPSARRGLASSGRGRGRGRGRGSGRGRGRAFSTGRASLSGKGKTSEATADPPSRKRQRRNSLETPGQPDGAVPDPHTPAELTHDEGEEVAPRGQEGDAGGGEVPRSARPKRGSTASPKTGSAQRKRGRPKGSAAATARKAEPPSGQKGKEHACVS